MSMRAVLTGDIVNSTRLEKLEEKKLQRILLQILHAYKHEFYRGDSFQVYFKKAEEGLRIALLCRTAAIGLSDKKNDVSFDMRIALGIGKVDTVVRSLKTAKGEAFILSGRALDEIAKTNTKLAIVTTDALAKEGLRVISDYINAIFNTMTAKQAEVMFELLKGRTQFEVARKLKKTKSTISQHVSAGRWPEIDRLLMQYENIVRQLK